MCLEFLLKITTKHKLETATNRKTCKIKFMLFLSGSLNDPTIVRFLIALRVPNAQLYIYM